MAQKLVLIPWDDVRVLYSSGMTLKAISEKLGIPPRTLGTQLKEFQINLDDVSNIPYRVWAKYPEITPPPTLKGFDPAKGLDLSWKDVEDYLAVGLSIAEVATACGVDLEGIQEAYRRDHPADFDCIEVWGSVLRARRNFDLFKALEKRSLDGDLRAFVLLQKQKHLRWPKDCVAAPNNIDGI